MRGISVRNHAKIHAGKRRRKKHGAWFPWWIELPLILFIGHLLVVHYR